MTTKVISNILNIILWSIIWLMWVIISPYIRGIYYQYMPIETFIYYQKFDVQNYIKSDKIEFIYAYRNSKIWTIWDFYFKTFCNWISDNDWNWKNIWVVLNKTDWLQKIVIQTKANQVLPVWKCTIYTNIKININWYIREIDLVDDFEIWD